MKYEIVHLENRLPLVIVFQGLRTGVLRTGGNLPYLYYNMLTTSNLRLNYIFFKDETQQYFHQEHLNVEDIIRSYVSDHNPSKIISIGQSAGGFSAILISKNLQIDSVISIAPQTNLDWYSFGTGKREHPRLYNLQGKFELPETDLHKLQPFGCPVEYWRPLYGEFDNYHFDNIDKTDKNLTIREFPSSHNIGNTIGKENFKKLILDSLIKHTQI